VARALGKSGRKQVENLTKADETISNCRQTTKRDDTFSSKSFHLACRFLAGVQKKSLFCSPKIVN
jgi:hypothetical protein